jgi:formylglycine-generating enzyme required for sulfatase activity
MTLLVAALTAMAQEDVRIERLPENLMEFKAVRLPEDPSGVCKARWAMATEVPFELFELWYLRMDLSEAQRVDGTDADSRPTKPYGAIFIGHGSHGHPAICVSLLAATEFAGWLSARLGRPYRLPTTAEWEYAARAGASGLPGDVQEFAWVWENAKDSTRRLATRKPNAWGLYDTLGNVAEWAVGPDGPVVCGGSWRTKAAALSFGLQEAQTPAWTEADPQSPKSRWWLSNGQFVGFRLFADD